MKYVQYKYVKKKILVDQWKKLSTLHGVTQLLLKPWGQYSWLQLRVRPCDQTINEETRHSSLGGFFAECSFLSSQQGQHERDPHILTGEFSGMPGCLLSQTSPEVIILMAIRQWENR